MGGSGDFNDEIDFASAHSGESAATLEDSRNNYLEDELPGESVHLNGELEIISTRFDSKYRYYHAGVWGFDTMARPEELLSCLEKANRDIKLLYVFLERYHLHAIQDCACSNASCKCFRIKATGRKSGNIRSGLAKSDQTYYP